MLGASVQVATLKQNHSLIAQAQIITRRFGPVKIAWLPRGPVWAREISEAQKHSALDILPTKFEKSVQWLSTPDGDVDRDLYARHGFFPILTPQYIAEIDLNPPVIDRLASQHGKWRNRLRHAQNSPVKARHRQYNSAQDQRLLALEESQRHTRGYRALPPAFTFAWVQNKPDGARIFIARHGTEVIAFLLVLLHHPVATYHIGWTGPQGRQLSAHNLLLWSASNWLAKNGYVRFDLGLVDTQTSPGLARFKIGSGACIRPLGPTMVRLPRVVLWGRKQHAIM